MVQVARAQFGADFEDLKVDPCSALEGWGDVDFQFVEQPDGDQCSVAGAYIADSDGQPPVIQVALANSSGRRAFTALHELGHHLQRTDIELLEAAWDEPAYELFEDMACDAFAAEMLIPVDVVARHIDEKGPVVDDVLALFEDTPASRSAVCVRVAQRLRAPGHVVLLTADGEVFFSSSRDLPPLRRGSGQAGESVIERGLSMGRSTGRGRFTYRDGIRGDELFMQTAQLDGDLLLVISVTDGAPWEGFALPSRDVGPQANTYECSDPACGDTYSSWEPRCPRCSTPPCTECGRCACPTRAAQRTCDGCWTVQPAAAFVGDKCADCS